MVRGLHPVQAPLGTPVGNRQRESQQRVDTLRFDRRTLSRPHANVGVVVRHETLMSLQALHDGWMVDGWMDGWMDDVIRICCHRSIWAEEAGRF